MERNLQSRLDAARAARRRTAPPVAPAAGGTTDRGPVDGTGRPDGTDRSADAGDTDRIDGIDGIDGAHPTGDAGRTDERPQVIDLRTLREIRAAARRARAEAEAEFTAGVEAPDGVGDPPLSWSAPDALVGRLRPAGADRGAPLVTTNPAQERCPNCSGPVRIDLYDLVEAVAHLACLDCGLLFTARSPHRHGAG